MIKVVSALQVSGASPQPVNPEVAAVPAAHQSTKGAELALNPLTQGARNVWGVICGH